MNVTLTKQNWNVRGQEFWHGRTIPLIFIPLALLLWLPHPWLVLGWIALPIYFVLRWRALGSPLPQMRVNVFVLLLLVSVAIGLMVSPARLSGVASAAKLMAGIVTLYVLYDGLKTKADVWRAASVLVLLGIGLALALPFAVSWSADKVYALPAFLDWTLRAPGQGANPNIVGGVLAALFPLAFALVFSHRRAEQIVGASALGPFVLAFVVLQARGAWFALLGGLAVGAGFYRRWLVPLFPLFILAALYANQQLGGSETLSDVIFGKIGTVTGGTLQERFGLWSQGVDLFFAHPFTGIGMGAYEYVAPYAPPYSSAEPGLVAPHAHNLFLQVALDTGIVGLFGFVGMLGTAFFSAWRAKRRHLDAPLPLAILTTLAIIVLHGLGDSVFWMLKSQWVLWFVCGIAFAFDKLET